MDFAKLASVLLAVAESPAGQKVLTTALDVLVANQALLARIVSAGLEQLAQKLEAGAKA